MSNPKKSYETDISPEKTFFFKQLTQDITIEEAVLELIDTFIEWLMYYTNRGVSIQNPNIKVNISKDGFSIESNYPGPPPEMVGDLLKIGKSVDKGCCRLGAYGLGTKRALFKLGRKISLETDNGEKYSFTEIDERWFENDKNWKVKIHISESQGRLFDKIEVKNLVEEIRRNINESMVENLKKKIENTYLLLSSKLNFSIYLNGEKIIFPSLKFIFDNDVKPYYLKTIEKGVLIKILAGLKKEEEMGGWYIFCNDRLIMLSDTTEKTGFDRKECPYDPKIHKIFLGIAIFSSNIFQTEKEDVYRKSKEIIESKDKTKIQRWFSSFGVRLSDNFKIETISSGKKWILEDKENNIKYEIEDTGSRILVCTDPLNLPWKSSKDSIRLDSPIYQRAKDIMKIVTKRFTQYINELKKKEEKEVWVLLQSASEKPVDRVMQEYLEKNEVEEQFKWIDREARERILKGIPIYVPIKVWINLDEITEIKEHMGNINMSDEEMIKELVKYYKRMEGIDDE